MKKYFLLILAAIVLGGFGCARVDAPKISDTHLLPPSPTIPSGWQTFSSRDAMFLFAYPGENPSLVLNGDPISLPDAVGHKSRTLQVQVYPSGTKLDANGCVSNAEQMPVTEKTEVHDGYTFCLRVDREGAAGSTYETRAYTITQDAEVDVVSFVIRYPTSVRVYAQCETDADQSKQECKDLAFDEARDTQLFQQIMDTFVMNGAF